MRYVLLLLAVQLLFIACGQAWAIDRELPVVDHVVRAVTDRLPNGGSHDSEKDDGRGLVFVLLLVVGAGILAWMLIFARNGQFGKALLLMSVLSLVVWLFVPIIPIFLLVPLFAFGGYRLVRRPRYTRQPSVQVDHVTLYREVQVQPEVMHVVVPHVVMVNRSDPPTDGVPDRPAEGHLYHTGSGAPHDYQGHAAYPDYVLPTWPERPQDGPGFPSGPAAG